MSMSMSMSMRLFLRGLFLRKHILKSIFVKFTLFKTTPKESIFSFSMTISFLSTCGNFTFTRNLKIIKIFLGGNNSGK